MWRLILTPMALPIGDPEAEARPTWAVTQIYETQQQPDANSRKLTADRRRLTACGEAALW
jgi:hypothetical protein